MLREPLPPGLKSRMLGSGDDAVDGVDEIAPGASLRGEHARTRGRQLVEPPPPLTRLLDPAALNPAALFQSIQKGVQRRRAEREDAARARFDQLAQLVAVAGARLDERKNQQFRAPLLQLAIDAL